MGVNLKDIISREETSFEELTGKKVGVDAFNIIYQFLSIIRQADGTPLKNSRGKITSHLSGLFYRTLKLLENNVKPCFVFDGKPPEFKAVAEERAKRKKLAMEKLAEARKKGDEALMMRYAQQTSKLTEEMVEESKQLLTALGVPCIQALSEGEAQCASMVLDGTVWAVVSQDYDALLFGAERLIRNLNITGRRKVPGKPVYYTIKPEIIFLSQALKETGLTREQLITLGILVGTDYNPKGIKGIGPKTGLKLIKQKSWEQIFKEVNWNFKIKPEKIRDFFLKPTTQKATPKWGEPDPEAIKKILCDEHEFSENRIDNAFKNLNKSLQEKEQKNLKKWF
ncbi:MAG: flap endonuclease-1 [Nanoarchaeota archaeon]|nr:flap endonuclease-1 [Nanoarchaeota archaeon]